MGSITFTPDVGAPCTAAVATTGSNIGQASCQLTLGTAGTHNITVSYGIDPNFSAVNVPETVTVTKATPTITITPPSSPIVATKPVTFMATVTAPPSPTGIIAPTSTGPTSVSFTVPQATQTTYTCALVTSTQAPGTASCSVTVTFLATASGSVSVNASYSGDSNYSSASTLTNGSTVTQTVQNFAPTVTLSSLISTQPPTPTQLTFFQASTGAQSNSNLADPYNPVVIQYFKNGSPAFSDTTTVTLCTVTPATSGLTCASVPTPTTTTGVVIVTQTSAVPVGNYTVNLTITDTTLPALSQLATVPLTIVNQATPVTVRSIGTATATFVAPSGLTGLSCNSNSLATLNLNGTSYTTNTNLANAKIQCSPITASTSGPGYTFTITAGNPSTARLETGNGGVFLAGLSVPFMLMLGLLPASRKLRKTLLHSLAIFALGMLLIHATGCGSGGFSKSEGAVSSPAVDGNYLIDIVNAQGITVAEVPLAVAD